MNLVQDATSAAVKAVAPELNYYLKGTTEAGTAFKHLLLGPDTTLGAAVEVVLDQLWFGTPLVGYRITTSKGQTLKWSAPSPEEALQALVTCTHLIPEGTREDQLSADEILLVKATLHKLNDISALHAVTIDLAQPFEPGFRLILAHNTRAPASDLLVASRLLKRIADARVHDAANSLESDPVTLALYVIAYVLQRFYPTFE